MFVQLISGKKYTASPTGYQDFSEKELQFRVLIENNSLDDIYKDFDGDTSSLAFTYSDGSAAWTKNGYDSLIDFYVMKNVNVGKDTTTGAEKYDDVVQITLSRDDFTARVSNVEDAVGKLTISTLDLAMQISALSTRVDELANTNTPDPDSGAHGTSCEDLIVTATENGETFTVLVDEAVANGMVRLYKVVPVDQVAEFVPPTYDEIVKFADGWDNLVQTEFTANTGDMIIIVDVTFDEYRARKMGLTLFFKENEDTTENPEVTE